MTDQYFLKIKLIKLNKPSSDLVREDKKKSLKLCTIYIPLSNKKSTIFKDIKDIKDNKDIKYTKIRKIEILSNIILSTFLKILGKF